MSKFYRQTAKIPAVYWGHQHCTSPRAKYCGDPSPLGLDPEIDRVNRSFDVGVELSRMSWRKLS